jgi:hypothetical protein
MGDIGGESEFEQYGPFGSLGHEVGETALAVLGELVKPAEHTSHGIWSKSDRSAFDSLRYLDTGVPLIAHDSEEVVGSDLAELHRTFARLRTALPFSEAEREWLASDRNMSLRKRGQEPEIYLGFTEEIMSGGIVRVLQGRDLVRRWWAWRRETEEFTDQASLHEARLALSSLAEVLIIESVRPPHFETVRAKLRELEGEQP